jgi:hypothetical protein
MAWSLKGFLKALQTVNFKALEYHNYRGDFESWAEHSLRDEALQKQLKAITVLKLKGEALRKKLVAAVKKHFIEAIKQAQASTRLF